MYVVLCTCNLFLQFVQKVRNIKYRVCEKRIALSEIQFSQCDDSIHIYFIKFLGTGFEVLTVVKIHNVVWYMTLYSLVHGSEGFGRAFCGQSPQAV